MYQPFEPLSGLILLVNPRNAAICSCNGFVGSVVDKCLKNARICCAFPWLQGPLCSWLVGALCLSRTDRVDLAGV